MAVDPELVDLLVCPKCKGPLEYHTDPQHEFVCAACRLAYAVDDDDIPNMLIDEARSF